MISNYNECFCVPCLPQKPEKIDEIGFLKVCKPLLPDNFNVVLGLKWQERMKKVK